MEPYSRSYPAFSLCGLNCGLCPRHHTNGSSRCPGCGGERFNELHPSCPIIRCSATHGFVEYCHDCPDYPCERYERKAEHDSFITYRRRLADQQKASDLGMEAYKEELDAKIGLLEHLITNYDDGRRKAFFCLAVNLLELTTLHEIIEEVEENTRLESDKKTRAKMMVDAIQRRVTLLRIDLRLRKPSVPT